MDYKQIINNNMIKHIQIQTIDSCNSKCITCPHKDLKHSGKEIDDKLFEKIIQEIKIAIDENKIISYPIIRLYLHNEPLLDNKLFDRIKYLRQEIPDCLIKITTNGFLMNKYKDEIVNSEIDLFTWSPYGNTEEKFEFMTGIKKSQLEIDEMYNAFQYIKEKAYFFVSNFVLYDYYKGEPFLNKILHTRAGYFNNNKQIYDKIYSCSEHSKRNLNFLNFFIDGDSTLCCQDWKKETVMGNVIHQTVSEIIESDKWYDIRSKTLGAPSDNNFICKRCELAEGVQKK